MSLKRKVERNRLRQTKPKNENFNTYWKGWQKWKENKIKENKEQK